MVTTIINCYQEQQSTTIITCYQEQQSGNNNYNMLPRATKWWQQL